MSHGFSLVGCYCYPPIPSTNDNQVQQRQESIVEQQGEPEAQGHASKNMFSASNKAQSTWKLVAELTKQRAEQSILNESSYDNSGWLGISPVNLEL